MKTEMTKEKMIKKSDEELLKKIIKGVKEKLYEDKPKDLEKILWENDFVFSQGFFSEQHHINYGDFTDGVVDYFNNNISDDEFHDFYYEWSSHEQKQLIETDEELQSIEDEEDRQEVCQEWVDMDGFTFGGFQNYIYYLINEVTEEFTEERIEKHLEILEDNSFESSWEWVKDYTGGKTNSSIELLGSKYCEYSYDKIEFYISTNFQNEKFEINPFGNDEDSPKFSFDNFKEFFLKLKELKLELDKKDNEIIKENESSERY
ncbi:MAG: hypothetical protein ACQEWG_10555 [Bacteroidota bacterium]